MHCLRRRPPSSLSSWEGPASSWPLTSCGWPRCVSSSRCAPQPPRGREARGISWGSPSPRSWQTGSSQWCSQGWRCPGISIDQHWLNILLRKNCCKKPFAEIIFHFYFCWNVVVCVPVWTWSVSRWSLSLAVTRVFQLGEVSWLSPLLHGLVNLQ